MKRKKGIKLFTGYLQDHIRLITGLFLCAGMFALVLYLHNIPFSVYGYGFLMAGTLGLIFLIWDYVSFVRRHRELYGVFERIQVEYVEPIHRAGVLEEDYRQILNRLSQQMSKQQEQANTGRKEMTDYYTLWAHQIKTPITAMRLLIQVEDTPRNAALMQQLLKIERYVEMVLQYLRMESMSSDLKLQEYHVLDLVKKAIKQDSSVFIYRKLSLQLSEMEDRVITDEKWMVFVIEQVLSNALKYTENGQISIYMAPDRKQTLVIEDTGIGIKEEDLPRIFENGFTGYNGRIDKKSTGIGLYLCKKILDRLGHSIEVHSMIGQGTKVFIGLYREELKTE